MRTPVDRKPASPPEDEIRLMDIASFLLRYRRPILGSAVGAVVLAFAAVTFGSKSYTARTVLVPPPAQGGAAASLLAGQVPTGLLGLSGEGNPNRKLIEAILNSSTLVDATVAEISGDQAAEGYSREQIRTILEQRTRNRTENDGSIIIEVESESPRLSAAIANQFPELINNIAIRLSAEAAERKQLFLEAQIGLARERLLASEQQMMEFQQSQDAPLIQQQAQQTLEAAATLQQSIMQKEVEVAQLRRTSTEANPALSAAVAELGSLRQQLRRITGGGRSNDQVFLSLKDSPALTVSAARLMRQFTADEQVYLSLAAGLAESQIDLSDRLPVVSVLDRAEVPSSPTALPLVAILIIWFILGLGFGILVSLLIEGMRKARRNPENAPFFATWDEVGREFSRVLPPPMRRRSHSAGSR